MRIRTANRRRWRKQYGNSLNRRLEAAMQRVVRQVLDDTMARLIATFWAGGAPDEALIAKVKAAADAGHFATGGSVRAA